MADSHLDLDIELLPGEGSDAYDREDIEVWVSVYEELAGFCDQLLSQGSIQDDLPRLVAHRRRLRRRLAFWRRRELETRINS
jgi:hypothetical protein